MRGCSLMMAGLCGVFVTSGLAPGRVLAAAHSDFAEMYCVVDSDPTGPTCDFEVEGCEAAVDRDDAELIGGPAATVEQAEDLAQDLSTRCQALMDDASNEDDTDADELYCVVDPDPLGATCDFKVVRCEDALENDRVDLLLGPVPDNKLAADSARELISECQRVMRRRSRAGPVAPELCVWASREISDCTVGMMACSGADAQQNLCPVVGPFSDTHRTRTLAAYFVLQFEMERAKRDLDPFSGSPEPHSTFRRA